MNALRHGLRARTIILSTENRDDFDRLHDTFQNLYTPQNPAEQMLVDQAVIAQWKLARADNYETASCDLHANSPDECCGIVARMSLATARLERAFFKAYQQLESIKAARPEPPETPAVDEETDPREDPASPEPRAAAPSENQEPANADVPAAARPRVTSIDRPWPPEPAHHVPPSTAAAAAPGLTQMAAAASRLCANPARPGV